MNLDFTGYFITPIYTTIVSEWVNPLIKATEPFIKQAKNNNIENIKKRNKEYKKNIGDLGITHHSLSLINIPEFKELQNYVGKTSFNVLDHMGYNLTDYEVHWTELWVQEFAKNGGGHHEGHIHYDNHISGFYFLKCSDKTSYPVFHDPRLGKNMTQLPLKSESEITFGTHLINYKIQPGTLILFPSFLEHQFIVDPGIDPFRFIHFNLQAVRKMILNSPRS
jgi:uncharacterized protein (TIGR02466 family)